MPSPTSARDPGPITVLIIEDDQTLREGLAERFRRAGCAVTTAGDVADGLASLEQAPPRFLILDLTLKDGFGTSALRYVRTKGLLTKVAVTTGSAGRQLLDAAMRLQPDRLFHKPYSAAELVGWVREAA